MTGIASFHPNRESLRGIIIQMPRRDRESKDTLVPTEKPRTVKSTLSPELSLTALGGLSLPTRDFSSM